MTTHININDDRILIGFDIRKPCSEYFFMTSYDPVIRYEEIYEAYQSELSGCNLFYKEPINVLGLNLPRDALAIAFDLLERNVLDSHKRMVSVIYPIPVSVSLKHWSFLGFDVVDIITQTSALHGFDDKQAVCNLLQKHKILLNKYGLLDQQKHATILSKEFDQLFEEHAPFELSGVWLKN